MHHTIQDRNTFRDAEFSQDEALGVSYEPNSVRQSDSPCWSGRLLAVSDSRRCCSMAPSSRCREPIVTGRFGRLGTAQETYSGAAINSDVIAGALCGPLPFMGKVMHLFMNMHNMVGKDFASGLANLKRLAEK